MILVLLACGGDEEKPLTSPTPEGTPTYYQDVAPILASNCVSCHREGGSGPFVLDSYDDVESLGLLVEDSVVHRRMPPFHADNSGECQSFEHSPWLSDEAVDTISSWVQQGMPAGEPVDIELPSFDEPLFEGTHSVTFETYQADFSELPDDYRCFVVDPQVTSPGYLTGFEVLPSNREIAHHMILYAPIDAAALSEAYARDDADPEAGYQCYGGPGIDSRMIAPWAPGSDQWYYPEGTGVIMEEGQILILQMHYSNAGDESLDATTVNLHIQETVEEELWTEFYVHSDIRIPPGEPSHVESLNQKIRRFSGYDGPISLRAVGPHLHKMGIASSATLIREDGTSSCLIDVPHYDFNWQRVYPLREPLVLQPDDRMEIECVYDSTGQDGMTYWGDGTNDEMCLMTVFATIPSGSQ